MPINNPGPSSSALANTKTQVTAGVYTFATLPSASLYPVGTMAWTTDQGMFVSDGVNWESTSGTEVITLSTSNTSAQNTALIQSACNLGGVVQLSGIGSFPVSSTILVGDNTTVQLNAGVELIQDTTITTPFLFFTNTNYAASPVTASGNITSVQYGHFVTKCSVTVPDGSVFTVGKYVLIKGDTTNVFNGVKLIFSIVGNVITWLQALNTQTPTSSGTITVTKANANCNIIGEGTLNGQFANGKTMANTYQDHAIMFNNVLNPFVGGGLNIVDVRKYCVCMANCENAKVNEIYGNSGSDGAHFYGPMYGVPVIDGVYGSLGDDGAIFQTVDGSGYTQYMPPNSGGSFFAGGIIRNIYTSNNGNSGAAVLYPNGGITSDLGYRLFNNYLIENVGHEVSNAVSGFNPGASVAIGNGYSDFTNATDPAIGSITMNNIRGSIGMSGKSTATIYIPDMTINSHTVFAGGEYSPIIIGDYMKIDTLTINQPYVVMPTTGVNAYLATKTNATVGDIVINQPLAINNYVSGTMPLLGIVGATAGGTITTFTVNNPQLGTRCAIVDNAGTGWTGALKINVTNARGVSNSLITLGGAAQGNVSLDGADAGSNGLFNFYGSGAINVTARRVTSGANMFVNTQSNVTIIDYVTSAAPTRTTPTTGGTVSCINKCGYQKQIIAPAGTLATLTLNLPANPINGEIIELVFTQTIMALTVSGGTLLGFTSGGTMAIGSRRYVYNAAGTVWV